MVRRIRDYVKYTLLELDKYVATEGSCIYKVNAPIHIQFPPHGLSNFHDFLLQIIAKKKIGFFDTKLQGIILDIKNIKVLGELGAIRFDDPVIHLNIEASCYLFKPQIGAVIKGTVKHISSRQIGVIIYRVFSVTIRLQKKIDNSIELNSEIEFRIKNFDLQNVMPFIEGELVVKQLFCAPQTPTIGHVVRKIKFDTTESSDESSDDNNITLKNSAKIVSDSDSEMNVTQFKTEKPKPKKEVILPSSRIMQKVNNIGETESLEIQHELVNEHSLNENQIKIESNSIPQKEFEEGDFTKQNHTQLQRDNERQFRGISVVNDKDSLELADIEKTISNSSAQTQKNAKRKRLLSVELESRSQTKQKFNVKNVKVGDENGKQSDLNNDKNLNQKFNSSNNFNDALENTFEKEKTNFVSSTPYENQSNLSSPLKKKKKSKRNRQEDTLNNTLEQILRKVDCKTNGTKIDVSKKAKSNLTLNSKLAEIMSKSTESLSIEQLEKKQQSKSIEVNDSLSATVNTTVDEVLFPKKPKRKKSKETSKLQNSMEDIMNKLDIGKTSKSSKALETNVEILSKNKPDMKKSKKRRIKNTDQVEINEISNDLNRPIDTASEHKPRRKKVKILANALSDILSRVKIENFGAK